MWDLVNKVQLFFMLTGVGMLAGAAILGFSHGQWVECLGLAGLGSSSFVYGTQHDR